MELVIEGNQIVVGCGLIFPPTTEIVIPVVHQHCTNFREAIEPVVFVCEEMIFDLCQEVFVFIPDHITLLCQLVREGSTLLAQEAIHVFSQKQCQLTHILSTPISGSSTATLFLPFIIPSEVWRLEKTCLASSTLLYFSFKVLLIPVLFVVDSNMCASTSL